MNRIHALKTALVILVALPLMASPEEPWPDPGPPASRDLFPLNLVPLTYRPVGARPLGEGQWRVSFQVTRSNTFEFSNLIKERLGRDLSGRLTVTAEGAERLAESMPKEPLLYFFDAEVQRTELSLRYGLRKDTDLSVTLGWESLDGGIMDGLIEGFHQLGFEQVGRSAITRNQLSLVVVQRGKVIYFSQTAIHLHPLDPLVTVVHRFLEDRNLTLSAAGTIQLPVTRFGGQFQSNWDSSASLLFEWRPSPVQVVHGGAAYLRRNQNGGPDPTPFLIKDQIAGHLGWEWRGWSRLRPFLVLLYHDSLTSQGPGATLDRPSVLHDLGFHLRLSPRTALTFSYLNNITHNENTADMGVSLRLSVRP